MAFYRTALTDKIINSSFVSVIEHLNENESSALLSVSENVLDFRVAVMESGRRFVIAKDTADAILRNEK